MTDLFGDRDLYVRFGPPPEGGRSRNWRTGALEAGVSAYAAEYDPAVGMVRFADDLDADGQEAAVWQILDYMRKGCAAYLLAAEQVVGRGSDGEPLLGGVEVLAELLYSPQQGGFVPWPPGQARELRERM